MRVPLFSRLVMSGVPVPVMSQTIISVFIFHVLVQCSIRIHNADSLQSNAQRHFYFIEIFIGIQLSLHLRTHSCWFFAERKKMILILNLAVRIPDDSFIIIININHHYHHHGRSLLLKCGHRFVWPLVSV